ncbi:heavy metal translocating P-type ATPase [Luteolibacter sp. AS25]|uniref:heavy metal translocating P-type ATPase n=1 Tax=Luteolibacter sp. AS25 TaxID=3135776 RepID=UPI00398B0C9C
MSCCQCSNSAKTEKTEQNLSWFRIGVLILLGGLSMYLSLAINISPSEGISRLVVHGILACASALALLLAAPPIFRNAFVPRISLEQLFLIGLLGSFGASLYSTFTGVGHIYYEVVVILLAIYHLGQAITRLQIARFSHLENQIPGLRSSARIISEHGNSEIPIANVTVGQLLEVRPGEVIPADGKIESGAAFIEQLAHTGEPFPAPLEVGAMVQAGSRVLDGTIRVRTTASGTDRELDRLLASCSAASISPVDSIAGKILLFFIPSVVLIACLTVVFWAFAGSMEQALFNGLAVTIVACPCGIGLAIPLAIRNAHMQLRLLGVIPHGNDLIERLSAVDSVAFDKTGTLSSSSLKLESITLNPGTPDKLQSWLATIQRHSTHPIARPLWGIAEPSVLESLEIESIPARGIKSTFSADGIAHVLIICNSIYLEEKFPAQVGKSLEKRSIHFILDGEIIGYAVFGETSREGAVQAIDHLLDAGYKVEILTGDSSVPEVFASKIPCSIGLTTEKKSELVRKRQESGAKVLLVGDGLNDTQGMRTAHASLAIGPEAYAASSVASATIAHYDFEVLVESLGLARFTKKKLTRLLAFTLAYNFVGIAFAASGFLHPVIAAALMFGSSITVLTFANRSPNSR